MRCNENKNNALLLLFTFDLTFTAEFASRRLKTDYTTNGDTRATKKKNSISF